MCQLPLEIGGHYSETAERRPRSADSEIFSDSQAIVTPTWEAWSLMRRGKPDVALRQRKNRVTGVGPRRKKVTRVASKGFFVAYLLIVCLVVTACSGVKGGTTGGSGGSGGSGGTGGGGRDRRRRNAVWPVHDWRNGGWPHGDRARARG